MSWLSQAFDSIGNDVSSFWQSNSSWLPYALAGAATIGTLGALGPEAFGAAGAFEGAELGAEAAGAGAAAGAGDVAIDVAPFGAGAFSTEAAGAALPEAATLDAGAGAAELPGFAGTAAGDFVGGQAALDAGGPLDFIAGTGASADTLAGTAPVAAGDVAGSAGGLQGGIDVASAQGDVLGTAGDLGGGSTPDVLAGGGAPAGPYPTETAGQAFGAGRFGSFATPDLSVAGQDQLAGGLLGQPPVGPSDQAIASAAEPLPPATQVASNPVAGTSADAAIANPNPAPAIQAVDRTADAAIGSSSVTGAGPGGGAGAGGLGGFLNNPAVKAAELGIPLAVLGGNILKGPDKLPTTTQANVDQANRLATYGATELNLAQAGQIDPAQEAQIQQSTTDAKNQLRQSFLSRGVGNPEGNSDYQQALRKIDADATAQRAQFIQTMIQNALNADSQASQILSGASNQQIQLDQQFNQSISSALQSFGLVAALSGGRAAAPAAAAATTG